MNNRIRTEVDDIEFKIIHGTQQLNVSFRKNNNLEKTIDKLSEADPN